MGPTLRHSLARIRFHISASGTYILVGRAYNFKMYCHILHHVRATILMFAYVCLQ
jgi:hypothetical protein